MARINPINKFAFANFYQVTGEDIEKLINAKPTGGDPVVYRAGLLDAGFFVQISEEEDIRKKDFDNLSLIHI